MAVKPWTLLATTKIPNPGGELRLFQRGDEFSINLGVRGELMNSRAHDSEDALASRSCARIAMRPRARVLIGGLGMGYTLAAALKQLRADAEVIVAELLEAVVEWNRGPLGDLAGHPLDDPRTRVHHGDVAKLLLRPRSGFDAILLDVDNGPEGLTSDNNDWLYTSDGLNSSYQALRRGGVLGVWSAGPDRGFTQRLKKIGYRVKVLTVNAHRGRNSPKHTLWLATRD